MWDMKEGEVLQAEQEVQSHEHGRGRSKAAFISQTGLFNLCQYDIISPSNISFSYGEKQSVLGL